MRIASSVCLASILALSPACGSEKAPSAPSAAAVDAAAAEAPKPAPELLAWADQLKPILPKILPTDRAYLSSFYDAMAYIILRDGDRSTPLVTDTEKFAVLHAGSLQLAIEKAKVGKYPGLDDAIDSVFFNALGAEQKALDAPTRARLVAACGVLSWTLAVKHE